VGRPGGREDSRVLMPDLHLALNEQERARLLVLEVVIDRGKKTFIEVGEALLEIRDLRLYRATHTSFEGYCKERHGFTRVRAHQYIDAARVCGALTEVNAEPPTNERQARELVAVLRDAGEQEMIDAWRDIRACHGERVTAETIRVLVADWVDDERARTGEIPEAIVEPYTGGTTEGEVALEQQRAAAIAAYKPMREVVLLLEPDVYETFLGEHIKTLRRSYGTRGVRDTVLRAVETEYYRTVSDGDFYTPAYVLSVLTCGSRRTSTPR
jgi:hypothetical protein